jgi:F0F1-type ATP synthase membrane subunit b/b'
MLEQILVSWSQIVIAVGVLIGALITVFKFFVMRPLIHLIDDRTKQIQPDANGGKSLADVHKRIDNIERTQTQILEMVTKPVRRRKPDEKEL